MSPASPLENYPKRKIKIRNTNSVFVKVKRLLKLLTQTPISPAKKTGLPPDRTIVRPDCLQLLFPVLSYPRTHTHTPQSHTTTHLHTHTTTHLNKHTHNFQSAFCVLVLNTRFTVYLAFEKRFQQTRGIN